MRNVVLVRAYQGQPLKRVVVKYENGRVFVANPESLQALEKGESFPVGFPEGDIFVYDEARYQVLADRWRKVGSLQREAWADLTRYDARSYGQGQNNATGT